MTPPFRGVIGRTVDDSTPWWPDFPMPPAGSPNVVLVVLDDTGFADLGCFGSEVDTPNFVALAAQGVRFNNFHTTALCSPTRAALLSGRNPHSVGMGIVSNWDTGYPGYAGAMHRDVRTLPEELRDAGYATFAVGKWHLAPIEETSPAGPFHNWPLQRGFDRYYGFLDGGTNHWAPDLVVDNHHIPTPTHDGYHLSEDLVDQAVKMVGDHVSAWPEKPFFLYLPFGASHYPIHVPQEHVARYRGCYADGWDALRAARFARQKELGIIPADTVLAPSDPETCRWDELDVDEQLVAQRMQEAYAGMLSHTDAQVGRVLAFLEDIGRRDDTLVVVMSDNGATREGMNTGYVNYLKKLNGLPSEPVEEKLSHIDHMGGPETNLVYHRGWAYAGNTPGRWFKAYTHAGGVRDPLIVSWPARLAEHAGAIRTQYHHVSDLAPTILELIGLPAPDAMEGTSLAYAIERPDEPTRKQSQYFEIFGHRGIWSGGWKAVVCHEAGTRYDTDPWELYHLDADFAEANDLAATEAARLQALVELWWAEAGRFDVLPLDDRQLQRFHSLRPHPITTRRRFEYLPGVYIPGQASPNIRNVSYTATARISAPGEGVLWSWGERFSGITMFVKDGRLVVDHNTAGDHYVLAAPIEASFTGEVQFAFERTGELRGTGRLRIAGVDVDECFVRTHGTSVHAVGVSVGADRCVAVSPAYRAPFPFTGTIHRVVFEVGDDRVPVTPASFFD